ncbi:NAD(P)H-hydrate dehydratase [Niveibacterium sp. 24ML]|uniref:NAD(P)H-hydrate dehydratase n=1 Tax=Niveibacterium sp. 24ML TaxID=2985512 RepID=UPI002270F768|nr:NAD(P)H-hydrate dehydratase [Niveibacterium sp. 24ML]
MQALPAAPLVCSAQTPAKRRSFRFSGMNPAPRIRERQDSTVNTQASRQVLTTSAIRKIEASFAASTPSLMQRAGLAAAAFASRIAAPEGPILVLVGPGNNGGDGLVLATELKRMGRTVVVALAGDADKLPPDASEALRRWHEAGGTLRDSVPSLPWALAVDALLGIGLTRPVTGLIAEWITDFNRLRCPRLAIDVPSGLDADTGAIHGIAARATHTISFIALKPGLLTLEGPDQAGDLQLSDLELPTDAISEAGRWIAPADFTEFAGPRRLNSHKGHFGDAGIIGGQAGMVGAAWIAGRAALALGSGRVFVGCLAPDAPAIDPLTPELMMRSANEVHSLASALAIGPGLGQDEAANVHLSRALAFRGPLVLDADALNLLGANPSMHTALSLRTDATVMTPHPAEAARLLQCSTAQVQAQRLEAAKEIAGRYRAHVVLKGCGSIIADPQGAWAINRSGNPGMASAGMGDALTGFVVSLLGQHWPAGAALEAAVHLHGAAADALAVGKTGPIGLTASEVIHAARRVRNGWAEAALTEAA